MQNFNESSHPLYPQNPQLGPTAATFLVTLPPEYYTMVAGLAADNERLRNRNIREELNEQAYSRAIASNGTTFVPGKNGRFLELMDAIIKESFHRVAEPPLCCEESYTIYLSWYKSQPLSLDAPSDDFSLDLLCRKDQPLFIKDSGRLKSAEKNSEILDSAILNGIVPWKNMRETQNLPIKAPITLLSSTPSALNCSPEVIILDFKHDDFEWEDWLSYLDLARHNQDYMSAFCGFTSSHIPALRSALAEGGEKALRLDKGQLTEKCHQAFGILLGLQIFLNSFYAYVFPDFVPISSSIDELADQLLELLTQTSEKADIASLPDLFIEIAKELIQANELHISYRKHYSPGWNNAVFYDDDAIYFTTSAFNRVCQAMMQSRPAILAALEKANLLCGAKTNKTTSQTRKTVYSMYGVKNNPPLYAFPREAFETFGDPLITEEEDTHDEP